MRRLERPSGEAKTPRGNTQQSPRRFGGFSARVAALLRDNDIILKPAAGDLATIAVAVTLTAAVTLWAGHSEAAGRKIDAGSKGATSTAFRGVVDKAVIVQRKSTVIEMDAPYATALIAEAEIADVVPLSDRSIYLLGKKVGTSRLTVIGEDQTVLQIVEVEVTPDLPDLRAKLKENLPNSEIHVGAVNGGIVLSGTVFAAAEIERAVAIASRYAPDAITNALALASPQQVMLEVRFVEASRTAARELGVSARSRGSKVDIETNDQGYDAGIGPLVTAAMLSGAAPFGTMLARVLDTGTDVDIMLRALEEKSLARRLAEPNLVTTSGDTASFLAGGEFPFPVSATDNRITIEFKQFGVALAFTPTVLAGGLINLKIAPEVSDIDNNNAVEIGGIRIPGLVVRRANTSVELRDGQSMAIAGLLQHTQMNGQRQLPWLGQVPILGTLFRSADYQKSESDLVIIVTPRLVKPKRPGETLSTPLDTRISGNDADFFLDGKAELSKTDRRLGQRRLYGHIINPGPEQAAYAPSK
ncbi:MAG: type II and III secretion system protein family protein [Hyphomicrobium sp.]